MDRDPTRSVWELGRQRQLKVAAGFEIEAVGADELALLLVKLCPAVGAGAFDLFDL